MGRSSYEERHLFHVWTAWCWVWLEGWPGNVTWRSSVWHICSHSRKSGSPQPGSMEAALKCLNHWIPKATKARSSWKFPMADGTVFLSAFSLNQNQRRKKIVTRFNSLYITSYFWTRAHYLLCVVTQMFQTSFPPCVYVTFLIRCVGKRQLLVWEMRFGQRSQTCRREWGKKTLNWSALQGKVLSRSAQTERFHCSFFTFLLQHWVGGSTKKLFL